MLLTKEDKNRPHDSGQIFVELTKNRDLEIVNCDRLGYWCDKAHLSHFLLEISRHFTRVELLSILKNRI